MDPITAIATGLFLSLLAAMGAVGALVEQFWYGEDLHLILAPVVAFAVISVAAFGVAAARVGDARMLAAVAAGLAVLALLVSFALIGVIAARSGNPPLVRRSHDHLILSGLVIPMLLAIVIQWRVVRRSWLQVRGENHATAWPWVTTLVAFAVVLNPLGVAIFGAAINPSATDWFAGLWRTVALIATGVLIVIALIEWRIRLRKRNAARDAA